MFRDETRALFWIAVITLLLAYYVAVTKEAPIIIQGIIQFWYAITGRTNKGAFANYPK